MKCFGLFSGIGGVELGLQRAGFEIAGMCEIDPYCRAVLRKHWPDVPIYEDVRELTADAIGPVQLISGGFPCQGISEAGLRAGLQDPRSALWSEYARIVSEVRPRYVLVENVSELLRHGYGMGKILGDLAQIGYDAEWHSIPALAIGADHIRERIWIIAYPNRAGAQEPHERGGKQRQAQVGKNASKNNANADCARLPRGLPAGTIGADARNISPWVGLALSVAPPFPGINGAGAPVLGRGEDGIPHRVDRTYALGNAVVPQIPEIIGCAILQAEEIRQ